MRRCSLRGWLLAALVLGLPAAAAAYSTEDSWCDRDNLQYRLDMTSFTQRGFISIPIDRLVKTAAAWWTDAQGGLRLHYDGQSQVDSFGDPGTVWARCWEQDPVLEDGPFHAYVEYTWDWVTSCDPFGESIDGFKLVVSSNGVPTAPEPCGNTSLWGLAIEGVRGPKEQLLLDLTHEFGHVLGLGHESNAYQNIMYPGFMSRNILNYDDANGLYSIEGHPGRSLKTVVSTRSGGTLGFWGLQNLSPTALWKPAISGNPDPAPAWDYALAWVDPQNFEMRVATGSDDANGTLVLGPVRNTSDGTRESPGVAVGFANRIGLAWTGTDPDRTVNFKVSSDGGQTWAKTVLWGQHAIGGVAVSYNGYRHQWVLSWVVEGDKAVKHSIATVTSDDDTGTRWSHPVLIYPGDTLTMPNSAPALSCQSQTAGSCLLTYAAFDTPNSIGALRQQALAITRDGTRLTTTPTDANLGGVSYRDLDLARFEGGYVMTSVQDNPNAPDTLSYRIKTDAAGEAGAFDYPSQTWAGAVSGTGFGVAYNYRTGGFRFLWHED